MRLSVANQFGGFYSDRAFEFAPLLIFFSFFFSVLFFSGFFFSSIKRTNIVMPRIHWLFGQNKHFKHRQIGMEDRAHRVFVSISFFVFLFPLQTNEIFFSFFGLCCCFLYATHVSHIIEKNSQSVSICRVCVTGSMKMIFPRQ